MKTYKKPLTFAQEVVLKDSVLTAMSPGKAIGEEGDGNQLTRRALWEEEEN